MKLLSMQKETLAAVLSTQARVDETRLRGQLGDRMSVLLDALKRHEQETPDPPPIG